MIGEYASQGGQIKLIMLKNAEQGHYNLWKRPEFFATEWQRVVAKLLIVAQEVRNKKCTHDDVQE